MANLISSDTSRLEDNLVTPESLASIQQGNLTDKETLEQINAKADVNPKLPPDPFAEFESTLADPFAGLETPTGIPAEGDFPLSTSFEPQELPEYTPSVLRTELGSIARSSLIGGVASTFNEDFRLKNQENQSRLASIIADGMAKHGMQVEVLPSSGVLGGFTVMQLNDDGTKTELDSDFWREIGNSKYEVGGAIGVAFAASRAGALLPGWGKAVSIMSGAALGASLGRGADIVGLSKATGVLEDLQIDFIRDQMVEAGVLDVALGAIGSTAISASKGTFKLLGRAYDFVLNGNTEGAFKALKQHTGIDDAQAKEIVDQWETITGGKAPGGSLASKAVSVAVRTQPGTEGILNQAVVINPNVGGEISKGIADRARNVLESVKGLTSDNIAEVVTDDLGNYVKEVKNFYGAIKTVAVQEMKKTDFRFDYGKLAIDPLIKSINRKVTNPALKEQLINTLDRARSLSKRALADRKIRQGTFQNLLDLRTVMNDFKHNRKIVKFDDLEAVDKVLSGIEKEIKRGVNENMEDPARWLKEWKRANTEYSKMLSLKDNIMFKALTKPGIDADKVTAILSKDIKAIDSTFMQVMGRLPVKTRGLVEGAVLQGFVKSRSIGDQVGQQAIDFVKLQKDLAKMSFTDPVIRDTKRAISKIADVFKNDVNLFRASGKVSTDKFQSYLTADPVVRLKFAFASTIFNKVSKLIPSGRGDASALIDKASEVLKNPSNSKSIASLVKELPNDPELAATMNQLAIEYAKFGYKEAYPDVKLFRSEAQPSSTNGRLGEGKYWTTDETVAKVRSRETGSKVISEKFKPVRIADETNLPEGLTIKDLDEDVVAELKRQGFTGFTEGNDMVIFND